MLTRRSGEQIIVRHPDGTTVVVEAAEIRSADQVRLAITAPDEVVIERAELLD